jgi:hypothetical protein
MAGLNRFGARTGTLTLRHDDRIIMTSPVFSGGGPSTQSRFNIIPKATFRVRTDIRKVVSAYSERDGDTPDSMHNWWGIEKIDAEGWQYEWGRFRAALNESSPNLPQAYRGNFLHGKQRPDDWTHGCICERSERILAYLWSLPPQRISVTVR